MNEFQVALLIGALVSLIISQNLARAWVWILLGAWSFFVSTAYARLGLPYPSAMGVACDAVVVLTIYHVGKSNYELLLWRVFQTMILINILYLAGVIGPHWAYATALEICNWAALLIIAGTAIAERVERGEIAIGRRSPRFVRHLSVALRRERTSAPWHKVPK